MKSGFGCGYMFELFRVHLRVFARCLCIFDCICGGLFAYLGGNMHARDVVSIFDACMPRGVVSMFDAWCLLVLIRLTNPCMCCVCGSCLLRGGLCFMQDVRVIESGFGCDYICFA